MNPFVDALKNGAQSFVNSAAPGVSAPIDKWAGMGQKIGVLKDNPYMSTPWMEKNGIVSPVKSGLMSDIGGNLGALAIPALLGQKVDPKSAIISALLMYGGKKAVDYFKGSNEQG